MKPINIESKMLNITTQKDGALALKSKSSDSVRELIAYICIDMFISHSREIGMTKNILKTFIDCDESQRQYIISVLAKAYHEADREEEIPYIMKEIISDAVFEE